MTSPSSRRAGVVQGPQHAATGPEPSSGVGPAFHLDEPEPPLRSYLELGALPTAEPAGKIVWCELDAGPPEPSAPTPRALLPRRVRREREKRPVEMMRDLDVLRRVRDRLREQAGLTYWTGAGPLCGRPG
jgi:hypothetical protein